MRGQGRVVSMPMGKETDRRSGSKGVSRYGRRWSRRDDVWEDNGQLRGGS